MSAVPALASPEPMTWRISLAMRSALGLLHTGALLRGTDGAWTCRAFPRQPVKDATVRALADRDMALLGSYPGLYGQLEVAVLTPRGRKRYGGGRLASETPPPVAADVVLREVEITLAMLDHEATTLRAQIAQDDTAMRELREDADKLAARMMRTEQRLAQRERARQALDARRVDLRALVAHAAERLSTELGEAGK